MRVLLLLLALITAACSGSAPTRPTPPPVQAPPPVAAPVYPNMMGAWAGTLAVAVVQIGGPNRSSNICTDTWFVTAQTGDQFSGTYQSAGGTTVSCATSGTFSGSVSTSGTLTSLMATPLVGGNVGCVRVNGDGIFAGFASASLITAQRADQLRCTSVTSLFTSIVTMDRTLSLSLNKR
jgi:hypothetical protein